MAKENLATFEETMRELEEILDKMSGNDVPLQEGIALYARAAELIKTSHEYLEKAKVQVREIDEKLAEVKTTDEL